MKKRTLFLTLWCALTLPFSAHAQCADPLSALLPLPNHIERLDENQAFVLSAHTVIVSEVSPASICPDELKKILRERTGREVAVVPRADSRRSVIELRLDSAIQGREHYRLEVAKKRVRLSASTESGIYYGLKTLDQLLLGTPCLAAQGKIAPVVIDDAPRYSYRALMLDPARHFLPVEQVKFFIEQMARYKYNVLQLHLTDDQGWRIEIKSHPELTRIGAFRSPNGGSNGPDNGFYTQAQLRELIAFAAQRQIEIVPELDVPGHTVALLAAHPDLGCAHTDTLKKVLGVTTDLTLCAANPEVYRLYDDILTEVAALFPSPRIHLGGDEAALERNWGNCPRCRSLMKQLGYSDEAQLMGYFFDHLLASVRLCGKQPLLWCELNNIYLPADSYLFDYPEEVTLVTWRYQLTPKCIELTAANGHPLIMAPGEFTYLDYPQLQGDLPEFNNWGMPVTTLEQSYRFDPGYGLPASEQRHILGVMGTLWGEAMKDINRVTYMAYPRALALSEAAWTQMEHRSWDSFTQRLYPNLQNLMRLGVSVRVPYEIVPRTF